MNKFVDIKNLSKSFYTLDGEIDAIKDISFNVNNNEFISIVGPSGCGKSTILNIIAGLDIPTKGDIIFNSGDPKIGYMFQSDALLPWLSILDNATLGLDIMNKKNSETINYTKDLLEKYGLIEFIDKKPDQLSGGMKQRVALIRTLAIKPDILLLDEPFSALDYQTRLEVADDVHKIIKNENKTVIMITHDISEAISLSDKVIVLSNRPSKVINIHDINFDVNLTPFSRRKDKNFVNYYDQIWKEIEKTS